MLLFFGYFILKQFKASIYFIVLRIYILYFP